ncbi:MAG: leucine--tRNA ligase [Candidatus Micrarchaeaceae archaeon]
MNYKEIEAKWQKAWNQAKVYEVEPNDRKPLLVTAAFPYVNSPQHIGHIRTYGTADTYARYMRMSGFNVLYPMAFHATGTPLLAFAKRIKADDKELIEELKMFHVPDSEIRAMSDPKYIADYFIKEMENGMRAAGYGMDWRRKFVSIEPLFSKLVEWQFMKLKDKGYITKGRHPIGWCTNDNNAVGQHDTKHDVQPEIEVMTVIKFKDVSSDAYFACATYRPETLFGATNIFIAKDAGYVIASIGGVKYYMSKEAAEDLKLQLDVKIEGDISAAELLSKSAVNPINMKKIPVLPGYFVKPDVGTGMVMSVPAHAPFDYVALQRLKRDNYPVPEMEIKSIIEIEKKGDIGIGRSLTDVSSGEVKPAHPEIPALAYLEILHANENSIDDMIEFATKLSYREESHWGVMLADDYKGMKEPQARDLIKERLKEDGKAFEIYIIGNEEPVYCRDGTRVKVKVVEDQWFINYGNEEWKKQARENVAAIRIYPSKLKLTFEKMLEWIDLRAAEREQGLGTRFPFDKSYVIESLSDSTIYMCFYTFVHILKAEGIGPDQLKPEFFDYVLLSEGDAEKASKSTGITTLVINRCKESFEYWYCNTSRHSAPDLIPNHLTMYIFNHVALFGKDYWPKQVVVNGFVDYEGEKMSKSLGNIVPLTDGIERYGADPLRFIEVAGADLDTSTEFTAEGIGSIHARNDFLYRAIRALPEARSKELSHLDYWLYSKLNSKISEATKSMDSVNLKNAYANIYYNSINELKKYTERGSENQIVIREFLESVTLMISPIMPHVAEEFWSCLGKDTLVVQEKWPTVNDGMMNPEEERVEEVFDNTVEDARQSIELTGKMDANKGKSVKAITIIIADQWKMDAYNMLAESKSISNVMESPDLSRIDKDRLSQFLKQFASKMNSINRRDGLRMESLLRAFVEAKDYLSEKFNASIEIESEPSSASKRAQRAMPEKPSIDVTWG